MLKPDVKQNEDDRVKRWKWRAIIMPVSLLPRIARVVSAALLDHTHHAERPDVTSYRLLVMTSQWRAWSRLWSAACRLYRVDAWEDSCDYGDTWRPWLVPQRPPLPLTILL